MTTAAITVNTGRRTQEVKDIILYKHNELDQAPSEPFSFKTKCRTPHFGSDFLPRHACHRLYTLLEACSFSCYSVAELPPESGKKLFLGWKYS